MPTIPQGPLKLDDLAYRKGEEGSEHVPATKTREWTIDGKTHRLLLSDENAKKFDADQEFWTEFAEVVTTGRPAATPRRSPSTSGGETKARTPRGLSQKMREWCIGQNFDPPVGRLGRIPESYKEAYFRAHPDERPQPDAA